MKDNRKFVLRDLTEQIYYIREFIFKNKLTEISDNDEVEKWYDELWKRRNKLEEEIFGKTE